MLDQHLLSFLIRWIHVISMSLLVGGAFLFVAAAYDSEQPSPRVWLAGLARRYEWVFWSAIGIQIITGIGNIGSFGAGVPPADSVWGTKLMIKLTVVTLFVILSMARTLVTVRVDACASTLRANRMSAYLRDAYGLSVLLLVAVVLLAEALAHG